MRVESGCRQGISEAYGRQKGAGRSGGMLNHRNTWELWTVAGDEEFIP